MRSGFSWYVTVRSAGPNVSDSQQAAAAVTRPGTRSEATGRRYVEPDENRLFIGDSRRPVSANGRPGGGGWKGRVGGRECFRRG